MGGGGKLASYAKTYAPANDGMLVSFSVPLIAPAFSAAGTVTWNDCPCEAMPAVAASFGICQIWPFSLMTTTLYLPGARLSRCFAAGFVASMSAGRAMTLTCEVRMVGGPPEASSAGRYGVGSTAAGITWVLPGNCERPVGSSGWGRTRNTRGPTSGRPAPSTPTG